MTTRTLSSPRLWRTTFGTMRGRSRLRGITVGKSVKRVREAVMLLKSDTKCLLADTARMWMATPRQMKGVRVLATRRHPLCVPCK